MGQSNVGGVSGVSAGLSLRRRDLAGWMLFGVLESHCRVLAPNSPSSAGGGSGSVDSRGAGLSNRRARGVESGSEKMIIEVQVLRAREGFGDGDEDGNGLSMPR